MNFLYKTLFSCAALALPAAASGQLIINELMQSNIDCIIDDLNEFPDSWVELYNAGSETVSLSEYSLCDKNKPAKAYNLPSGSIPAGKYIVIYCDKAALGRHTDFRLDSGKGGSVYLFHNGELVDKVEEWKKQPAPNIAYGRETDNSENWGYQAVPTPGEANCGTLLKDILGDPVFSIAGRVATSNLDVEISLPEGSPEGTVIRYTLDGEEPTPESPLYEHPIHVSSTRTIRAKLFCDGYLSPRSLTNSYIVHPRDLTLPVISIVTNNDYFYDNKLGIYVKGNYTSHTPNYEYDWRRPINIEFFTDADKDSEINQLCETRVKGGATRGNALKSLAVYANKRFGTKRFTYEFFPDQTPGIDNFKSFELRNTGNDFDSMYMRDCIIQQSMGMNCDLDWQPSQPVIFYINGVYKGILNIRPRSNEDYVYSFYDELEDIDIIENWWELKEGSMDNFNAFTAFYTEKGHSFEEFETWMDTAEFCNLMIMATFFDNKDFPGNNIVMWRPIADGGRWRWIAKDTDFGMGLYGERYNYPTLNWITTPGYDNHRNDWANKAEHSRLFRRLLDTPEFKDMFIDRCAVYMGDFLTADAIIERINKRYDEIKTEYKFHRDLINPWWPNYSQEVENGKNWSKKRGDYFYNHLASFFGLEKPVNLSVSSGEDSGRSLSINGVQLRNASFNGKFFQNRQLVISSDSESDGLYVNGWTVKTTNGGNTVTETYKVETLSINMPEASDVEISPILGSEPLAVKTIEADIDMNLPFDIYDYAGRNLGNTTDVLTPGIYLIRQGSASKKILIQ